MCGPDRIVANSNNGYVPVQMNPESTLTNEDASFHATDSSDVLNPNEAPDRHQGWHTGKWATHEYKNYIIFWGE